MKRIYRQNANPTRLMIFLIVSTLAHFFCSAQNTADNLRRSFIKYSQQTVPEKIFAHTDKSFYVAGEIIWFKLYNVEGYRHRPLSLNKVAYAEVINADKMPVLQGKIALQDGEGQGSFQLPLSMTTGAYILRAYTAPMKNEGPDFFFEKPITLVNTATRPDWQKLDPVLAYDAQFFPEGGNLVYGLQSVVGFKVVDQYGRGVNANGVLLSESNDTVLRFQTFRFGMGRFTFTPINEKKYTAALLLPNGQTIRRELPTVDERGYVMRLGKSPEGRISITVSAHVSNIRESVYLVAHTRSLLTRIEQKEVKNGTAEFLIDKNDFGEGLSHLTLFDQNAQPVGERLYFKKPRQHLRIIAGSDQSSYGPRQSVSVTVNTQTATGGSVPARLSLSVFRLDSLQAHDPNDIQTYLWLTSELRGTVESPAYYFNETGAEQDDAMENLLLTQGWRRFKPEEILKPKNTFNSFLPEYEGHIVKGKVRDVRTGEPAANISVYLTVPGQGFRLSNAVSTADGSVHFVVPPFYGSDEIIVQTAEQKDSFYRIEMENPFSGEHTNRPPHPFLLSEKAETPLTSHSLHVQAANAYSSEKRQRFVSPSPVDSTPFYGKPDIMYFLDDYTRFTTMEEVMREYVAEVRVRKQDDGFHYNIRNTPYQTYFENDPVVLVDGVPVSDVNKIMALDPLKVKKLDVLARRYFFGNRVADGIVSYTTYEGDLGGIELDKKALVLDYTGLQAKREFYSPVYDTPEAVQSRLPDLRPQLFWSPDVRTDASGKTMVSFYTSDLPGNYKVIVQGLTEDGSAGVGTTVITILKK